MPRLVTSSGRRRSPRSPPRSCFFARCRLKDSTAANTESRWEPARSAGLAMPVSRAIAAPMKRFTITGLTLLCTFPAYAIVGGGTPTTEGVGRAIVTIVGSRGNFCTGALIAPKIALTAAHCVQPGADYKIVETGADRQPRLQGVTRVAIHPAFKIDAMMAHRATADVALLQLAAPVAGTAPAVLGDGKSGGTIRVAGLVATGKPGTLQIRLVDPLGQGAREGMGACTGDSGGPVFEDKQTGPAIVGVISWSTGPNMADGCGGLTGVTPLTLYREWILQTARQMGGRL